MEHIKNILAKLIVGKKISDQDIKRVILGKNAGVVEKIAKHFDQTANVAAAIRDHPKILVEVTKSKAIDKIFKLTKKR